MNKLVSVVVRAYNAEKYICEAVNSIVENTYDGPIEIVVCYDMGSKDRTLETLERLISSRLCSKEKRIIKLIKHEHTTPFRALVDHALPNALGDFVAILDYDNIYPKTHIERMVKVANETGSDFIFVRDYFFDDLTRKIIGTLQVPENPYDIVKLIEGNYIDGNAMFMGRSCLSIVKEKLKRLNQRLYDFLFEDWLIALIGLKYCKCLYTDESYVLYRAHGANITGINVSDFRTNVLTAMRNISTLIAFYELEKEKLSVNELKALERSIVTNLLWITKTLGEGMPMLPLFRTFSKTMNLVKRLRIIRR
jgi:glycosyltransferase involved in cell wall biosynthesis